MFTMATAPIGSSAWPATASGAAPRRRATAPSSIFGVSGLAMPPTPAAALPHYRHRERDAAQIEPAPTLPQELEDVPPRCLRKGRPVRSDQQFESRQVHWSMVKNLWLMGKSMTCCDTGHLWYMDEVMDRLRKKK